MGYTHYWTFKAPARNQSEQIELKYQKALTECTKVLKALKKGGLELSGYSANSKKRYGGLKCNGKGEDSHEDFCLREHFKQNLDAFNFCKTARKPYDLAIVACLAILKHRLGGAIEVSSDGRELDWAEGVSAANRILGLKSIKCPLERRNVDATFGT